MKKFPSPIGKTRLHTRIFMVCSAVLITALLSAYIFISIPTMNVITEDYIQTSRRDMALISNMTESTLSHLFNYAISIATDSRVIEAAKDYPDGLGYDAASTRLRSTLGQNIRSIVGVNSDIYMYDLLTLDGEAFGVGGYTLSYVPNDLPDGFFRNASETLGVQIHGPYSITVMRDKLPAYVITKSVVDLDTREPYGVLMLVVRETRFSNAFSSAVSSSDISYFVVDDALDIVSCKDGSQLTRSAPELFGLSEGDVGKLRADGQCIAEYNGSDTLFMLSEEFGSRVDWRILMATSMHRTRTAWQQVYANVLVIILAACFVLLIISYKLSQGISRPINRLVDSIHSTAEHGNMQPVPDPGGGYEIEVLYKSYNELLTHIGALIDHINQEQEEKSNYKFQLIQAQIKPHFLYNTLMTIKSLIDLDMNETASECVYAMSSFYRLSLNKGNDILTLGDEIELSLQYMYIQKLRYIDRLDYIFDVPRSLYECYLPKMTIQPILENAIYHGVKEKAGKGVIEVTGRDLGDRMEFAIADNGCGMNEQTLAQLRASINSRNDDMQPHNESFGLYSVNRRIRMLYGEAYGLHIDSRLGEYTVVTLILPKNTSYGGIS